MQDETGSGLANVEVLLTERAPGNAASRLGSPPGPRRRGRPRVRDDAHGLRRPLRAARPPARQVPPRLDPFELASDADFPWLSTELDVESSAPESAQPLHLVLPRGHSIRGRLLDESGAALVGYVVVGKSSASSASPAGTTADDGSFTLEVLPGTVWDLEVHGAWQTAAWDTVFHTELGIAADTRELVLRVDVDGSEAPR